MDETNTKETKKKVHFSQVNDEQLFNTSKIGLTPALNKIKPVYKSLEDRSAGCVAPPSTISRPNYEGFFNTMYQYLISIILLQIFLRELVLLFISIFKNVR